MAARQGARRKGVGVPRQSRCAARTVSVKVSPEAFAATAANLLLLNQVGTGPTRGEAFMH